jgi:hypothetical protein
MARAPLDTESVARAVAESEEARRTLALGSGHVHPNDIAYATRVDAFAFAMEVRRDARGFCLHASAVEA